MKKLLYLLGLSLYCVSAQAQNTLAGNLTVQQTVKLTGSLTPPTITSSVNDYAPTGFATAAVVRVQSDVPRSITGLAGGAAGRMVWLTNVGTQAVTLATESASSVAANRFSFGASSFDLLPGASVSIWYDTTSSRWRAATNLAVGGGGGTTDQVARDAAAAAQATADSKQDALVNATTLGKITEAAGLPLWDGSAWPGGGSGGTGTVTSVSVVSANGVSGSVATATTTPAITLSLGAVTPASVAAVGAVSGSNLSGTNTGDQTSVTGNAGTATALQTARLINGVSFDGTANVTVPAVDQTARDAASAAQSTASAAETPTGAQAKADAAQAYAVQRANHTGSQAPTTVTQDATHRFTTDTEKTTWNALVSFPGFGTTGTTAAVGNDARLSDARTPLAHNQAWSTITTTPTTLTGYGITDAQPLDSDLTSIAALTTTTFGRSLLTQADATATRTTIGAGTSSFNGAYASLTGIPSTFAPAAHNQAVSTISDATTVGQNVVKLTNPSAITFPRFNADNTVSALSAAAFLTAIGGQTLDSDLTALAGNSTNGLWAHTASGTGSARTITGTANQVTVTNGDGVSGNPTLSLPQSIATASTPQFALLGVGVAAAAGNTIIANNTDSNRVLFAGTTKGVRFTHNSTGSVVEGVDNTGSASHQPLYVGGSYVAMTVSGTEKMRLSTTGLGINGPANAILDVYKNATGGRIQVVNEGENTYNVVHSINYSGGSYIPLTMRASSFVFEGGQKILDGTIRFSGFGAGTLVTDSSGNVTASSDRRLKDVGAKFTRGLDDVVKIQPRFYTWKPESGMNTEDVNVGFIAQDVQDAIPEAVGTMKTSNTEEDDAENPGKRIKHTKREAAEFLTLSDRPIIAALVNAVKELKVKNDELEARIKKLEAKK